MKPATVSCCSNFTWFNIQRVGVDLDVQVPGGSRAELLEDAVDSLGDVVWHRLDELHLAVDDHAAFPKVENLQFLEARQVGLQVRQQLKTDAQNKYQFVVRFCHVEINLVPNISEVIWETLLNI